MHGLNRELMVQRLVRGDAPVAAGPYADAFGPYVNKDLKPYPYDVGRAKALLAEAGFKPGADGVLQKDGKRLAFSLMVDKGNPEREQIALYTQQSWKQLGADVKVDVEEWSVYIKRGNQIPSGDYDARTSWRITSPDPDKTAEYTTGGVNNHYAYSNPEVDALMAKARSTVDEGARVATFRKLQELIHRDAPLVWIYHQTEILAMNKRVQGLPRPRHPRRAAVGAPDRGAVTAGGDGRRHTGGGTRRCSRPGRCGRDSSWGGARSPRSGQVGS